jgi:putative ATP-binding cassette transporter
MRLTKKLNVAVNFYGQFAVIFPMLVSAPRYFRRHFAGRAHADQRCLRTGAGCLSWFINAFTTLASWKASINRLAGFHADVERAAGMPRSIEVTPHAGSAVTLEACSCPSRMAPDDAPPGCARGVGRARAHQRPSGCGKSTLIRAMADIWPYGQGRIGCPRMRR